MERELTGLGFGVVPSQTNFLLVTPPGPKAEAWLGRLRDHKIIVRWFRAPGVDQYLRISIGTDAEMGALLKAVRSILANC